MQRPMKRIIPGAQLAAGIAPACAQDTGKSAIPGLTSKKRTLVGLLLMGAGFLVSGTVSPVLAAPPDCSTEVSKRCKNTDGGGDGGGKFTAKFCLDIADQAPGLAGDGSPSDGGDYCDRNKKDKVLVFTGNGPGFRFDTNQGKGKTTPVRYVQIIFPAVVSL